MAVLESGDMEPYERSAWARVQAAEDELTRATRDLIAATERASTKRRLRLRLIAGGLDAEGSRGFYTPPARCASGAQRL